MTSKKENGRTEQGDSPKGDTLNELSARCHDDTMFNDPLYFIEVEICDGLSG